MSTKHNLESLDRGQLDIMYSMMKLRKGGAYKSIELYDSGVEIVKKECA